MLVPLHLKIYSVIEPFLFVLSVSNTTLQLISSFVLFLLVKQQIFYMDDELSFIKGQLQNADLIYRLISIQHPIYKFIQSTPSITLCRCCYFTLFLLLLLLFVQMLLFYPVLVIASASSRLYCSQKFGTVSRV